MVHYRGIRRPRGGSGGGAGGGAGSGYGIGNMSFLQGGNRAPSSGGSSSTVTCQPVAGTDGVAHPNIICFRCNRPGHYSNGCPIQLYQLGAGGFGPGVDDIGPSFSFFQCRVLLGQHDDLDAYNRLPGFLDLVRHSVQLRYLQQRMSLE